MKRWLTLIILVFYLTVWNQQKNRDSWFDQHLSLPLPAPVIQVISGYASQLSGFLLFIKVAVFEGNLPDKESFIYGPNLAQNLDIMSQLYPEFVDIYYYTQSFLAPLGPDYAARANLILDRAIEIYPDNIIFLFFQGFNYFYHMQDHLQASEKFLEASRHTDAPPWFAHFAGTLMARGGNLIAGLNLLESMAALEEDENMRQRYLQSIENFNKAIQIQQAINEYVEQHESDPPTLSSLIPYYIETIPELSDNFFLKWEPPLLRLERKTLP